MLLCFYRVCDVLLPLSDLSTLLIYPSPSLPPTSFSTTHPTHSPMLATSAADLRQVLMSYVNHAAIHKRATIDSQQPGQALDLVLSLALIHHFPDPHVRELGAQQITSDTPQKAARMPSSKTRHHSNPHAIDPKPNRRNSQRRVAP